MAFSDSPPFLVLHLRRFFFKKMSWLSLFLNFYLLARVACGSLFTYGQHFPNGLKGVDYMYSSLWKDMNPVDYKWNFYKQWATANHPYDPSALVAYANGKHFATCRGANGHLLLDWNHDGEIDTHDGGFAFHEHNGEGGGGRVFRGPFTNFWFDDNWLARYVSNAYGRADPNGLSDYDAFIRWKIVGGDAHYWSPYGSDYFDTLALDGLYYLVQGDEKSATDRLARYLSKAGTRWDGPTQQYDYPKIDQVYYYGLGLILASNLLESGIKNGVGEPGGGRVIPLDSEHQLYLDHYVSLRSHVLSLQARNDTSHELLGWVTGGGGSLMNAETTSTSVLGLGSNLVAAFEAGSSAWAPNASANVFVRPYNALSAVDGLSVAGAGMFASNSAVWKVPRSGTFDARFAIRSNHPQGHGVVVGRVIVTRTNRGQTLVLASYDVHGDDLLSEKWALVSPGQFSVSAGDEVSFNVVFEGVANLDVSFVHVVA